MGDDEQQALPLDLQTDNSFLVSTAIAAVLIAGSAFFCGSHIITARRRDTQLRKQDSSASGDPDSKRAHDSALVESVGGVGAQTRSAGSSVVDGSDGDAKEGKNAHRSKERRRRGKDPVKELLKSGKKVKVLPNPKPTLRDQGAYGDDSSSKTLASSVQIQESDQQKQRRKQEQKEEENFSLQSRRNLSVSSSTRSVSAASTSSAMDDGNRTTASSEWTVASTDTPQHTPHGTEREREDLMSSSTHTLSSSGFSEAGDAQELDTPESQTSELPSGLSEQQRLGEMDMELETPPRLAASPMSLPHRSSSGSAITPTASQLAPGADDTTPTLLRGTSNSHSNPTNSNSNSKSKSAAADTISTNNTPSNITAPNNTKSLPPLAKPASNVPSTSSTTTNTNTSSKASPVTSSTSSSRRQSAATSPLDPWDWDGQGSGSGPTPSTSTSTNSTAASAELPYRKPPRFQAKRTPSSSSRPGSSSSSLADGGGLRALHTISSDDDSAFPALGSAGSGSSKAGRSRDPSSGPGDAVGSGGSSGNTTTGHRRAPTPRRTPTPSTPPPSLSVQTQLASLRGALEAARIREEKMRTDLETLRWENANWRRRDLELQAQLHQFMHVQAYNASFAAVSPPATQGGSQPPPLPLPQHQPQHQSTGSDGGASPSGPHPSLPMPNLHLQMFNQAQMISSPNGLLSPMLSPGPHSPFYPYPHPSYMSPHPSPGMFNTMYPPPPVGVNSGNGFGNSVGPRASRSEPSSVAGSSGSGSPDLNGEPGSRRPDRGRRRTRNWEEGAEGWEEGVPEQEGSASWEDKEGMEGSVDSVEEDAGDSGSEVNEALADAILKRPGSIRLKKKGSRRMEERERVDMDEATEFTFPSLSDLGNVRAGKRVTQEAREIVEDAPSSGPLEVEQPTLLADLETDQQLPPLEQSGDTYTSAPDSDTAIPHSPVAAQQNELESENVNYMLSR